MAQGRIVVGVDGSPDSLSALRWAADYAKATGLGVEIICAYDAAFPDPYSGTVLVQADEIERIAKESLQHIIDAAELDGIDVEAIARPGHAPVVLLEAAKEAPLLVVGSRGHGALASMLLGSTSRAILHHPPCPVVVVPPST